MSFKKLALYQRRLTRPVWVGQIAIGGHYPIRVQSMITADTKNTTAVISEIEELVDAGCELIRVTVPTVADCNNLPNIRMEMKKRSINAPLIADIHFTPKVALDCVEYVDKVRVNPGNFVDKKLFKVQEYTNEEYQKELDRIREKFTPLVLKCKEYGKAIRIGTNHGSLSDRILNRYGDTPQGMAESALEFVRVCVENDFHNIILSMKASNVQVMIEAYRTLVREMDRNGYHYPLHLGVTEAGEGEDGRIKSAIGIGTLLEEGIGDTIRVSLTENAVYEVPVAYQLVAKYNYFIQQQQVDYLNQLFNQAEVEFSLNYLRRVSRAFNVGHYALGGANPVRVLTQIKPHQLELFLESYQKNKKEDFPIEGVEILVDENYSDETISLLKKFDFGSIHLFYNQADHINFNHLPKINQLGIKIADGNLKNKKIIDLLNYGKDHQIAIEICLNLESIVDLEKTLKEFSIDLENNEWDQVILSLETNQFVNDYRKLHDGLKKSQLNLPVQLRYQKENNDYSLLRASVDIGAVLTDGLGDSLLISGNENWIKDNLLSYNILQASRLRITKAEYISCPSCGRTLFDLQTTTDKIREATHHLKGVKIGVMGCIVNGPGEMADADFGYVGTGAKKISLYVGQECVVRNIPEEEAVNRLVDLIKSHHRWVDP